MARSLEDELLRDLPTLEPRLFADWRVPREASAPEITIDRVLEDPELGALAPAGLRPAPALRSDR